MKDIALALGGGGVKGNAHIGVLRVLEDEGYSVRALAGTSAGGLWGSLFAFGYSPDEIQRRFSQLDLETIYERRSGDGPSWMGNTGIRNLLQESLGDCTFEDLRIPFAVTAVDINTAERVVLGSGSVANAVSASIAIPGVFPPVEIDGRTLIDGGVLDPVPVGPARSMAPRHPVIAVVLSPPMDEWSGMDNPRLLGSLPIVSRYLARSRIAMAWNIFLRSMDISGAMFTELLLELNPPDVIIRPAVPHIGLLDRVDVAEVAQLGEQAARTALPDIEEALHWTKRLIRQLRFRQTQQAGLPNSTDFRHGGKDVVGERAGN